MDKVVKIFAFVGMLLIIIMFASCSNGSGSGNIVSVDSIPKSTSKPENKVDSSASISSCGYAGAEVVDVTINNGYSQRSRVLNLKVTIDKIIPVPSNANAFFEMTRKSDNAVVDLNVNTVFTASSTVFIITFVGGAIEGPNTPFTAPYSLKDGIYNLNIKLSNLEACEGKILSDYYIQGDTTNNKLFRLFGDSNGDGAVAANDFIQFRLWLGSNIGSLTEEEFIFDFDGDGAVAANDFIQFRLRFGGNL